MWAKWFGVLIFNFLLACCFSNQESNACLPSQETCEFWLTIDERLVLHWDNIRVYAKDSVLYRFDESQSNYKTKIPLDEVITMDGIERNVVVANNSIPGPPIIVYQGQKVIVHVTNHMLSESITIHWHGIHQKGTPFSDGVAFITQCPISPGQHFSYVFEASPSGTFFYHSHIGGQRVDGLFGALIIKPRQTTNFNEQIEDRIMHVGEWYHDRGSELYTKMIYGNFKTQPGFRQPQTLDGVQFAPYIWKSAYIEGKGRYLNPETGNWTETPLKVYNVTKGAKYRFRVIASGLIVPLRVSVDDHKLVVVATDGYDVEPVEVESLIINPGERFDFILNANQTVGNFWIRVDSTESNFVNHYVRAVLRYEGASMDDPTTNRRSCKPQDPCKVLNCMFLNYPLGSNTDCVRIDELVASQNENDIEEVPQYEDGDSEEVFLNWVAGDRRMTVNGKVFEHPSVSSLTQSNDIRNELKCNATCEGDKNCYCYHEITIPRDKTIQMIWTNHGFKAIRHHPIHLHGHSFHVLKVGFGSYNATTGKYVSENADVHCSTNYCNNPRWANQSWGGDKIPNLNLKRPIQKDTLMIPAGAYAVIRFRSNNPGKWFLHCHVEFHSMQGMALVVNEAADDQVLPPRGFPICQNFYSDEERNINYITKAEVAADEDRKTLYCTLFIIFLALFILETIILIVCCVTRKNNKSIPADPSEIKLKAGTST